MDGGPTDDATRESVSSRTRDASRVRFILVEPQFGGNVGSAARAIKNLGFTRLDVVAPACDPFAAEARRMAVDAVVVIEAIRVYPDLDAALEDAGTVVGTSRQTGKQRRPHFRMDEIAARLAGLSRAAPLAIVFGRQAHGLNDAELDRCTHLVHLLADVAYPSFNLAQAVLVGPVLAAQFGFLPGTLWFLAGVLLGGAVQDFVILALSLRRDGRSLAKMARDTLGPWGAIAGTLGILLIMVILIAVLGLVVVNALAESPWGVFTVGATIPIALLMGGMMRGGGSRSVAGATAVGLALLAAALVGGHAVAAHATWGPAFTLGRLPLAWIVIVYGLAASVLPVWLFVAPRDYLSALVELGTIALLAVGVPAVRPGLHMPPVTPFVDGSGPHMQP